MPKPTVRVPARAGQEEAERSTPEKIGPGDFDPTLGALREGVIRVTRDKALREVGGRVRHVASGDRGRPGGASRR